MIWTKTLLFTLFSLFLFTAYAQPSCEDAFFIMKKFSQDSKRPTINKFGLNLKLEVAPPQFTEINLAHVIKQLKLQKPTTSIHPVSFMSFDPQGEFVVIKFAEEWQPSFLPYAKKSYAILKKVITDSKKGIYRYDLYSRFYLSPHLKIKRLIFSKQLNSLILNLTSKDSTGIKSSLQVIAIKPNWSPAAQQFEIEIDQVVDKVLFYAHPQDPTQFLIATVKPKVAKHETINLIQFIHYSTVSGHVTSMSSFVNLPDLVYNALVLGDSDSSSHRAFFLANQVKETFTIKSPFFVLEKDVNGSMSFSPTEYPVKRNISTHQSWIAHEYHKQWDKISIYNHLGADVFLSKDVAPIQYSLSDSLPWGALISIPGNGYLFQEMTPDRSKWLWFPPSSSSPIFLDELEKLRHVVVTPNTIAGIRLDNLGYPQLVLIDLIPQILEVTN